MNNQIEYWNEVAYEKNFTTPLRLDIFSEYVEKNARILDYGCGYGRTLFEFKEAGYSNLFGIDFSKQMINRAKSIDDKLDVQVVESGKIPYDDNSFDAILLLAVMTCVQQDDEQDLILQEIKRVLKPEGIIYINDFLINNDDRYTNHYEKFVDKYSKYGVFELDEGAVLRHHDQERVKEWIKDFQTLVYEKVQYTTMNGNKSNGVMFVGRGK